MKTKILYWAPSLGLAAGFLSFLVLAMLLVSLALTATAHAKPLPCVESLEHCAPSATTKEAK